MAKGKETTQATEKADKPHVCPPQPVVVAVKWVPGTPEATAIVMPLSGSTGFLGEALQAGIFVLKLTRLQGVKSEPKTT